MLQRHLWPSCGQNNKPRGGVLHLEMVLSKARLDGQKDLGFRIQG